VRAERNRSRAVARAAAAVATTGAALTFAAGPADASVDGKPQPHTDTATTTTHRGHGHARPAHPTAHGSKHATTTSDSTLQPHTATQATTGPAVTSLSGTSTPSLATLSPWSAPEPATAPDSKPAATARHTTNWQRQDTDHADKGVVRAFAADLKNAGKSAGFPAFLVGVMAVFLLVQHRLDKRDVKLSQADWVSDQGLEFSAPATIQR